MPNVTIVGGQGFTIDRFLSTSVPITLYVRVGGSDSNDGLTIGNALLTIQAAIDKVPASINHTVLIDIGPGTFDGFQVVNKTIGDVAFTIQGTMDTAVVATGTATGTSDGGDTTFMADSGQGWTVDDLKGKFVLIDGTLRLIQSNDATNIYTAGYHSLTMTGKAYVIQDSTTLIESAAALTYGIDISNVSGGASPYMNITQMKLTTLTESGVYIEDVANITLNALQIDTPTHYGVAAYRSGLVTINEVYAVDPADGGFLFRAIDSLDVHGIMSEGDGTSSTAAEVSCFNVRLIDSPTIVANDNGSGPGIDFSGCGNVTPRRLVAGGNNTCGIIVRDGTVFSRGTYAPVMAGAANTTWGMDVQNTSCAFIGTTTTITGASGDLTLDASATVLTWAVHFANNGDIAINPNRNTRVERED